MKLPTFTDYDITSVEFFDFTPDEEHLKELSGNSYSISDGASIVPIDDDADQDDLNELLEGLDVHDPGALDDIADKLEDIGFVNAGNIFVVDIMKEKKITEYILYYELDKDSVFIMAQCPKKSVLEKYLSLVDQMTLEFKIKMIVSANPDTRINLKEYLKDIKDVMKGDK